METDGEKEALAIAFEYPRRAASGGYVYGSGFPEHLDDCNRDPIVLSVHFLIGLFDTLSNNACMPNKAGFTDMAA